MPGGAWDTYQSTVCSTSGSTKLELSIFEKLAACLRQGAQPMQQSLNSETLVYTWVIAAADDNFADVGL